MAVSKRVRYEVLRRDGNRCRYCGADADESPLTMDHVVPVALGGSDDPSNLVAACKDCNAGKTSTAADQALVVDVSSVNVAFAAAMKQAADELYALTAAERAYVDEWVIVWDAEAPPDWKPAIVAFYRAHLPIEALLDCIRIARGNPTVEDEFRYMCGVAWNRINDIQARAAQLMASPAQVAEGRTYTEEEMADLCDQGLRYGAQGAFLDLRKYVTGQFDDLWSMGVLA